MSARRSANGGAGRPPGDSSPTTRAALLDAGLEIFAAVGYDSASTRSILTAAGVTAPVLYHHFGTKAGLYAAVARHVNDIVVAELEDAAALDGDLSARLRALLQRSGQLHATNRAFVRFLVTAPLELRFHAELRDVAADMQRVLQVFTNVCREHKDEIPDVEAAVHASHVLLQGVTRVASTMSAAEFGAVLDAVYPMLDGPPFATR